MMTKKILSNLVFALLMAASLIPAQAAEPTKVVIAPFKMNADRDLSFLREGIVDMLTTRISWQDKVSVVPKAETQKALQDVGGQLTEATARQLGKNLGAQFVLFGSLTVFGESVSMDAKMVDVQGVKPTVSVFDQSKGMDEVIPKVNNFAADINEKVFGRQTARRQVAPAATPPPQQPQTPGIYDHPEKLLGYSSGNRELSGLNPDFILAPGGKESSTFWKSGNFEKYIKSIAIGDVDGDGRKEVVFVEKTQVYIYRNDNNTFTKIKEIKGEPYFDFLGVDVADVNGNGVEEIFVTNLIKSKIINGKARHRDHLASFVLEWNGTDFETVSDKNNWFFRVIELSDRGKVLFGQARGMTFPFMPTVNELAWIDGQYQTVSSVKLKKEYNIFGFVLGDVTNSGSDMILAYNQGDYLQLMTLGGSKEWKSDEPYGGSADYIEVDETPAEPTPQVDWTRIFLGQRILLKDTDNDGKLEVVVYRNQGTAARLFARMRNFTHSEILNLSWNEMGLATNWKTRKIHGYVSDLAIDDFDNDGEDEMVAVVVMSKGVTLLKDPKSAIISYDLVGPEKKETEGPTTLN